MIITLVYSRHRTVKAALNLALNFDNSIIFWWRLLSFVSKDNIMFLVAKNTHITILYKSPIRNFEASCTLFDNKIYGSKISIEDSWFLCFACAGLPLFVLIWDILELCRACQSLCCQAARRDDEWISQIRLVFGGRLSRVLLILLA